MNDSLGNIVLCFLLFTSWSCTDPELSKGSEEQTNEEPAEVASPVVFTDENDDKKPGVVTWKIGQGTSVLGSSLIFDILDPEEDGSPKRKWQFVIWDLERFLDTEYSVPLQNNPKARANYVEAWNSDLYGAVRGRIEFRRTGVAIEGRLAAEFDEEVPPDVNYEFKGQLMLDCFDARSSSNEFCKETESFLLQEQVQ